MTRPLTVLCQVTSALTALVLMLRIATAEPQDPNKPTPPLQPSASPSSRPTTPPPPSRSPGPTSKELKNKLETLITSAAKREVGTPQAAAEKVEIYYHPEFSLGQSRDLDPRYLSMNSAPAVEAVSEAMSIMAEIAVERAKRNGLELLRAKLIRGVCGVKQPGGEGAQPLLRDTCAVVKQTSFERLAGEPTPLFVSLARDLLEAGAANAACLTAASTVPCRFIRVVFPTMFRIVASSIAREHPSVTKEDAWVVTSSILYGGWLSPVTVTSRKGCKEGCVQRFVRTGLDAAAVCLKFKAEHAAERGADVSCDVPMIVRRLAQEVSGTAGVDPFADDELVEASRIGTLALQASLAMRQELTTGVQSPNALERLRASVELVFAILDASPPGPGMSKALPAIKTLLLATLDGDEPRMIAAGAEILVLVLKDDPNGQQSLKKATALLSAVAGYASTFLKRETDENDKTALRASRKKIVEGLIDAATVRSARYGDLVFSVGSSVGFLMGGQIVRGSGKVAGASFMPPQLSLPVGVTAQLLPGSGVVDPQPDKIYMGLHGMITVLDLAQFLAYNVDGTVTTPRWDTAFCPGLQVAVALGTPSNMLLLGAELRYAPTLFADTTSASPSAGGAVRVGLLASYSVPFFDLN